MPTKVIQRPDAGSHNVTSSQMDLERIFRVAGDVDDMTCKTAVDSVTGLAVPQHGSAHASNPDLIVTDVSSDPVGLSPGYGRVFDVRVRWVAPYGGDTIDPINPNNTRYQWDFEEESETVDQDIYGRPFINAAQDPVLGGYQLARQIIVLRVWRQEPVFDVTTLYQASGRVNSEQLTVLGETVPKNSMVLWSYKPTTVRRIGQTGPVDVEMLFKFKEPKDDNDEPWQAQFQNVGYNGFCTDTGAGFNFPFKLENASDYITEPIPLDNTGKPLIARYKVGPNNKNPISIADTELAPFVDPAYPKLVQVVVPGSSAQGYWKLIFSVRKLRNFQNFIPGIM